MENSLGERCNVIEECYEFMLAYAAQGLPSDQESQSGTQLREFLHRAVDAVSGLSGAYLAAVTQEDVEPSDRYQAFLAVLERDANDSLAALGLVLAQPAISSQLIDNLNASVHLRALLTDVFLLGEVLRTQRVAEAAAF